MFNMLQFPNPRSQPRATQNRSRLGNDPGWVRLKDTVCSLYETNKLSDVMRIMEHDHHFKASENMYKKKLKAWGKDSKRIKAVEYKAMIKNKRRREHEDPGNVTEFLLDGQIVPNEKITRWEDRMLKRSKITEGETFSHIRTPDGLIIRTPVLLNSDCLPFGPTSCFDNPEMEMRLDSQPPIPESTLSPTLRFTRTPGLSPTLVNSNRVQLSTPVVSQWNKIAGESFLFRGTLDDLLSLDASLCQNWKPLTPDLSHDSLSSVTASNPPPSPGQPCQTLEKTTLPTGHREPSFHSATMAFETTTNALLKSINQGKCMFRNLDLSQFREDLVNLLRSFENPQGVFLPSLNIYDLWENHRTLPTQSILSAIDLLRQTPCISLDRDSKTFPFVVPQRCQLQKSALVHQESNRCARVFENGTLNVTIKSRKSSRIFGMDEDVTYESPFIAKDEATELNFKPNASPFMFKMEFYQDLLTAGSLPQLHMALKTTVPNDSPVFKVAANGSIDELISLIAGRQASLLDYDTYQRSLLHYAVMAGNLEMCGFLLFNGLDVDDFTTVELFAVSPLHIATSQGDERMTKILLDAGADPTIRSLCSKKYTRRSVFSEMCLKSNMQSFNILRQVFERSSHFDLTSTVSRNDRSCLRFVCASIDNFADLPVVKAKMALLFDNGCNIQEIDQFGNTCLTYALRIPMLRQIEQQRDLLIFLLTRGANPYQSIPQQISLLDLAYSLSWPSGREEYESYRGDILDVALQASGYDIFEARRHSRYGFPYRRKYGREYGRTDFEILWRGREHLCPYWDDDMWVVTD